MPRSLGAALLFFYSIVSFSAPELLNGVAASVGQTLVTIQDAYVYRSLQRFRIGQKPALLMEKGQALRSTVQKIVFEEMVVAEAKALEFKDPDPQEAQKVLRLQTSKGNLAEWKSILNQFTLKESDALKRLQRSLLAEKFFKKKIDSLTPLVTDGEIAQYIANNSDKIKSLGSDPKSTVAAILKKERTEKGLQGWIQFLTEKYSASVLLP
jgi:hypothetical protein